jgi:hypothetical protein
MRGTLRRGALAAVVLGLSAAPFAGTSHAGCVDDLLRSSSPNTHVVTIDDEGRIIVDPHGADAFIGSTVGTANAFVSCVA